MSKDLNDYVAEQRMKRGLIPLNHGEQKPASVYPLPPGFREETDDEFRFRLDSMQAGAVFSWTPDPAIAALEARMAAIGRAVVRAIGAPGADTVLLERHATVDEVLEFLRPLTNGIMGHNLGIQGTMDGGASATEDLPAFVTVYTTDEDVGNIPIGSRVRVTPLADATERTFTHIGLVDVPPNPECVAVTAADMAPKKRWWFSWVCYEEDHRSALWPMPDAWLGYWCSGYGDGDHMVGWVEARTAADVEQLVRDAWPDWDGVWRIEPREKPQAPGDRFPRPDWVDAERWIPACIELKIWPEHFRPVAEGSKTFEIRKDDRPYRVGAQLHLREWDPVTKTYTGAFVVAEVTYLTDFQQQPGWVVMGLRKLRTRWNP